MAIQLRKGSALDLVNMTPMIDCIFQLLLFFMLAAQFKDVDETEFNAKLPSASAAAPLTEQPDVLYVDIAQNGQYSFKQRNIEPEELQDLMTEQGRDNPGRVVRIRADQDVAYHFLVRVLDICTQAGLEPKLAVETPPQR